MKSSSHSIESWISTTPKLKAGVFSNLFENKTLQWWAYIALLLVTDFIMVGLGFRLAYIIRFNLFLPIFNLEIVPLLSYYQGLSLTLIPIWIVLFSLSGLYSRSRLLGGTQEYAKVFRANTIGMLLVIVAGFLDPVFIFARGWLVLAWGSIFLVVALGRFLLRRVVYALRMRGFFLTPALIIGANDEGRLLGEQLYGWWRSGLHVMGYIDDDNLPGTPVYKNLHVLGDLDSIDSIVEQYNVGELVLATSALNREKMLEVFKRYGMGEKINLRLSSGLFEIITTGLEVKELAYVPLVNVNKVRITGLNAMLKTLLDIGLTVLLLVLLSPLLLLIAIAIRLDSEGPIIHRRWVMGVNGTRFQAFKFRTMVQNGGQILEMHPTLVQKLSRHYKLVEDPRVTKVGKLLRRYSLDELPQLVNVLRGEMSLVGPRMISPPEMKEYSKWGINLLTVRPGITGLWQVSGRSDVSYEKRVQLDMYYIRNWSIWSDLYILLQTIPAVIKGRGAY